MDLLQKELSFDSCAGEERIFAREIAPAGGKVRGVLQIAHGMAEHSQLYLPFADWLAREGFAVAINDHLGHGRSVSKGGAFGYFGPGGAQNLVRDMRKLAFLVREEYPDAPYFLMGHSMGSFLARSMPRSLAVSLRAPCSWAPAGRRTEP